MNATTMRQKEKDLDAERNWQGSLGIAMGGNCNLSYLRSGIRVALGAEGFQSDVEELPYDSWIGPALGGQSGISCWVVWISALGASAGGLERGKVDVAGLQGAISAVLARNETFILILPEVLEFGQDQFSPFAQWHTSLVRELSDAVPDGTILIDPGAIHRKVGNAAWFAGRYWSAAKIPCHPDAATELGVIVGRAAGRALRPKVKAIVVDLDGTLWGGVVGDEGALGIELDESGLGRPYLQLQRLLKDLSERGVPICIASKNNEVDALEPFAKRSEMILQRQDIVHFIAGWDHKHIGIQRIATELQIGVDAICFLDDSSHERSEARAFLPDLIVPELSEDPEERIGDLLSSGLFDNPRVSAEDKSRVEYYHSQSRREETRVSFTDQNSYLKHLDMTLSAAPFSACNLVRVSSLIQKTNQFNLTNDRTPPDELAAMEGDPNLYAFGFSLKDKFGDAGLIGVLIGKPKQNGFEITHWVMSCRVINRQVELAMYDHLVAWIRDKNIQELWGKYVPSKKNQLVMDLYERVGMLCKNQDESPSHFEFHTVNPIAPEHTIRIKSA